MKKQTTSDLNQAFPKNHKSNKPKMETIQNKIIAMWALVHGLSAIATMPNVEYDKDWEARIEDIIKSI